MIFRFLFNDTDLIGKNVYGRVLKLGLLPKVTLDGAVIDEIRPVVENKYPASNWNKCVNHLNQIISRSNLKKNI